MVIVECCDWCGGPHPTVVNCEKAQWIKQYRKAVEDVNRMNDKGEIPPESNGIRNSKEEL